MRTLEIKLYNKKRKIIDSYLTSTPVHTVLERLKEEELAASATRDRLTAPPSRNPDKPRD